MGLFGTTEGRQRKYDESKKNLFGFPLPEFGVSEYLNLPNLSGAKEKIKEKEQEEIKDEAKDTLGDSFDQNKYFKSMRNMMIADTLLRDFESRMQARRDVNVMKQTLP